MNLEPKNLAIYGAGGFGREMALMVQQINDVRPEWNVVGFFDDGKKAGEVVDGLNVLGGINDLNAWETPLAVVVALADTDVRRKVVGKIQNEKIDFPVLIHPRALVGEAGNHFGKGTLVTGLCILTVGIELGEFVVINAMSSIGHDVKIGAYSSVMPGSNISGAVTIGEGTLIGTGAQVLQNLTIGANCKVGAGAVVTKSVAGSMLVIGIPAAAVGKV